MFRTRPVALYFSFSLSAYYLAAAAVRPARPAEITNFQNYILAAHQVLDRACHCVTAMLTGTNSLAASHQHPSSYRRHKTCSQPLQLLHNIPWGFVQHLALPVPACNSWLSLGYCSSRCVVAAAKKTASSVASKGFGDPSKSPPSKAASRATQKCPCWSGKQYQVGFCCTSAVAK